MWPAGRQLVVTGLRVQQAAVQLFPIPTHIQQMCGHSTSTAARTRHESFLLHRQPHSHGWVPGTGNVLHSTVDHTPNQIRAVHRLRQGATVTALTVMQTLGLMAAAHMVVPLGLLHMRRLQRWFSSLRLEAQTTAGDHPSPPQWRATSGFGGLRTTSGGGLHWDG